MLDLDVMLTFNYFFPPFNYYNVFDSLGKDSVGQLYKYSSSILIYKHLEKDY